jgi:hypothetical protein
MSSYLTFYGIPKSKDNDGEVENKDKSPVALDSFSRNNDIYRYFDENLDIAFCYDGEKYSDITQSDVDTVESDILNDIRSSEKRLIEYEKYAGGNPDYVSEILSIKEYLEDLYRALHYTEFIGYIVNEASLKYRGGFEKIVANIS